MSELLLWSEMSSRQQLESMVWDCYKEVHGIRPRFLHFASMTDEELSSLLESLEMDAAYEAASCEPEFNDFCLPSPVETSTSSKEDDRWSDWEDHFDKILYHN